MRDISIADCSSALSDECLQLILMPTEQCNFRCVYCFESFLHGNGKMPPSIVNGIKNLLSSRFDNLTFLEIAWFGGEPLLAMDVITSISEHIGILLRSHPYVRYKARITTNGYLLTPDVFRKLLDQNIFTYEISFDGLKEHHDQKRVLANGNPTFDRLWKNLAEMKTHSDRFDVTVQLHVDGDNIEYVSDFLRQFKNDFGDDDRFVIYITKLGQFPNSPRKDLNLLTSSDFDCAMKDIRRNAESFCIPLNHEDQRINYTCFATKLNCFVIRSNGKINKCIVALDSEDNQVGTINENGTLSLDRIKLLPWARGLSSGVTQELECPLRGIDSWNKKLS